LLRIVLCCFVSGVDPAVVDPRSFQLDCPGSGQHLTGLVIAIAHHQTVAVFIELISELNHVGGHLGLHAAASICRAVAASLTLSALPCPQPRVALPGRAPVNAEPLVGSRLLARTYFLSRGSRQPV
jgi:hypothetical protein